jgi:catecholate siderophore receptor
MPIRFKAGLLIASITSIAAMPAVAQSTSVDEIVVTSEYNKPDTSALKMPIPLVDVPQSLTIIGQEEVKLRGYGELGDLVRYTPGVNTSQGEGHRDAIVFRGVRSTADFFIDGVRDDVQYYRPLYNLEQVEILRGPNAMLFGRGSTGGALNRVTKKAVIGTDAASADLSIDSFGAYNVATDINMAMSADSSLRINAFVETLENDRDYYDGDRFGINPTYRRAIDNQTTLDLSVELMDHERFIDRGIPTGSNGAPVDGLRDIVFGSASLNTQTLEATIFRGTLTREFSDTMTGVFNVHYADYEKMYQNLYPSGYDGTAGTVTLDGYRDPTDRTHMIINGHITSQFTAGGMSHTLLVGGEYIDTENENHRFNSRWSTSGSDKETVALPASGSRLDITTNSANAATTVNFDQDLNNRTETDITATSFFVQDQIAINDKLQVLLGARFDDFELTLRDTEDPAAVTSEDRNWDEVSPRFGLIYKPQRNVSLYASSSETFMPRSGEQYKAVKAAALDPDEYENTEYGVKWDVSDELTVTASMFEQEAETESSVAGEGFIQQLEVDGFELQVNGKISDRTSVSFGYSDMDGEAGDGGTAYEVPETMYSLFIDHQASERLSYGIGLTYQDESIIKQKSRKTEPQPYMPDYTRIDASLSYVMSDDTTVRVIIENLADEDYYPHSHATHQVSVGDPTNAKISLSHKF